MSLHWYHMVTYSHAQPFFILAIGIKEQVIEQDLVGS